MGSYIELKEEMGLRPRKEVPLRHEMPHVPHVDQFFEPLTGHV
jgi:hypothetical protein